MTKNTERKSLVEYMFARQSRGMGDTLKKVYAVGLLQGALLGSGIDSLLQGRRFEGLVALFLAAVVFTWFLGWPAPEENSQ